jgi:hypothetical protein
MGFQLLASWLSSPIDGRILPEPYVSASETTPSAGERRARMQEKNNQFKINELQILNISKKKSI